MKTLISLAIAFFATIAHADNHAWTYYQLPKVTDAAIGNDGKQTFFVAPNTGGTGLSAGKVTLLDENGAVLWNHQSGDEMLRCKVAASESTRVVASVSTERSTPFVTARNMFRVWVPGLLPSPRPTYTIALNTITNFTTQGVHVSKDGRWAVCWVHDAAVELRVDVIDTQTATRHSLVFPVGSYNYFESSLSDSGATLFLQSVAEEIAIHVRPDSASAEANSTRFPILWENIASGGIYAITDLSAGGTIQANVAYASLWPSSEVHLRIKYNKRGDFNFYPQATYEWGEWFRLIFPASGLSPISAAVSPDGNTVATGMAGPVFGQGGIGIVDLTGLNVQPITNWPPWTGTPPLVNYVIPNTTEYIGYKEIEFISNNTLITVSKSSGRHPKVAVWRKGLGNWIQGFSDNIDISDQYSNTLRVSRSGKALVFSFGVPFAGQLGSYLKMYDIVP